MKNIKKVRRQIQPIHYEQEAAPKPQNQLRKIIQNKQENCSQKRIGKSEAEKGKWQSFKWLILINAGKNGEKSRKFLLIIFKPITPFFNKSCKKVE